MGRMGEMGEMGEMGRMGEMGNSPSSFSDPIYPIKRSVTYQALAIPSIST